MYEVKYRVRFVWTVKNHLGFGFLYSPNLTQKQSSLLSDRPRSYSSSVDVVPVWPSTPVTACSMRKDTRSVARTGHGARPGAFSPTSSDAGVSPLWRPAKTAVIASVPTALLTTTVVDSTAAAADPSTCAMRDARKNVSSP